MKKYMLMLSCSFFVATAANALNANDQLKAVKEIFMADFQKMDDNKDGVLSKEEYLSHQFENFRANIINADSTSWVEPQVAEEKTVSKKAEKPKVELNSLADVNNALQEMADYDLDATWNDDLKLEEVAEEPKFLTKEDVMPQIDASEKTTSEDVLESLPELDLTVSEEDNLRGLLSELTNKPEETSSVTEAVAEVSKKDVASVQETASKEQNALRGEQITLMLDTIRKTLPQKIDAITTWIDVVYENNTIVYIYKADIDVSTFTAENMQELQSSIKNEACVKAYTDMCPRFKPLFIKEGINVKIRYEDNNQKEISYCEFNNETCSE